MPQDHVIFMPGASPGEKQQILAQRKAEREARREGVPKDIRILIPMVDINILMKGPLISNEPLQIFDIPDINLDGGQAFDLSVYVKNPSNQEISSTRVVNLNTSIASYNSTTMILTGVGSGSMSNLQLGVTTGGTETLSNVFVCVVAGTGEVGLWLGDNLNGEFGAIAVNSNPEGTIYEYTPLNRPQIPTIPEPTGDVSGRTTNGDNSANGAPDEYLMFTWDASVIHNTTYRVVFFMKGISQTGDINPNYLDASDSGSPGQPRWFVYCDKDDPSAVQDIYPWLLSEANQARVPRMGQSGASYINFVGLSYGSDGFGRQRDGTNNILYYRCYEKEFTIHSCGPRNGACSKLYYVECFADTSGFYGGNDVNFCSQEGGTADDVRIITCEFRDLSGDVFIVNNANTQTNFIVEDCNYERTKWTTNQEFGDETADPSRNFARGENFTDIKGGDRTQATVGKVIGNTMSGFRLKDTFWHAHSGNGSPFAFANDTDKSYIDVSRNVIDDTAGEYIMKPTVIPPAANDPNTTNLSINFNLINDFRGLGASYVIWTGYDQLEYYFNTVRDTSGSAFFAFWRYDEVPAINVDWKANCVINSPAVGGVTTSHLGAGVEFGHSAWVGTGQAFEWGLSGTNYTNSNLGDKTSGMYFGDFIYRKRKLTVPTNPTEANGGLGRIAGVVPTPNTPLAFRDGVQIDVGARSGIGVSDEIFYAGAP
jgi:hypothetical protein